jgi:hypothetical protein
VPSEGRGDGSIVNVTCFLENYIELMIGSVFISEVDFRMYVVISKAQMHVLLGN